MSEKKEETKESVFAFEDALKRVETIVEQMEKGELGLDDLVARFEEGQRLVQFCTSKLNEVERRIEKLVKLPDGSIGAEPFGDLDTPEATDVDAPPQVG